MSGREKTPNVNNTVNPTRLFNSIMNGLRPTENAPNMCTSSDRLFPSTKFVQVYDNVNQDSVFHRL